MASDLNLLNSFEWIGEFWRSWEEKESFPGTIKYTPRDGLMLTIIRKRDGSSITESLAEEPMTFHGYAQEAGEITLLGVLSTGNIAGNFTTTKETFFCKAAILGGIWAHDYLWEGCSFYTNNLDDFCRPRVTAERDEFTREPVATSDLGDITLSLRKTATGTLVGDNISSLLLLDETQTDFKEELDALALRLADKYGASGQIAKSQVGYEWHLESHSDPVCFETLLDYVRTVCGLLSTLMLQTVRPIKLSLLVFDETEGKRLRETFSVVLSMWLADSEKFDLEREVHYQLLPVNLSGICDFALMHRRWCGFARDELNLVYSPVLSHIKGERGMSHTILLISAIEQWTTKYSNAPPGASKYDWAFDEYCNDSMKQRLADVIPLKRRNGESLGALLSRTRAAVLHPSSVSGSPRNSSSALVNGTALANVGEILFVVLVVAIYRMLGVDQQLIHDIQNNIDRYIAIHHDY